MSDPNEMLPYVFDLMMDRYPEVKALASLVEK